MDIPLSAEPIIHIGHFAVTNSLLMSWLVMSTMIILAAIATRQIKLSPGPIQNFVEFLIETFLGTVESVAGKFSRTFFPIVATFFFFILFSNWMGLLPGISSIGINEVSEGHTLFVPFFRSPAADVNTTLGLALLSVVITQFYGLKFKGLWGYVKHYFHNPVKGGIALVLLGVIIGGFLGFLEIVSELVKIVSLSFRLFGNVYSGEVVISTISGIFSYLAPVPFLLLEVIVGFVQATVFALLSLVFFTIISQQPEEH
jgi:F-type H+-transporting ATPase subunit a